jgi:hypothetical protein
MSRREMDRWDAIVGVTVVATLLLVVAVAVAGLL